MARDPYCLFAYWEVRPADMLEAAVRLKTRASALARVLRMYDITGVEFDGTNANHTFDIDVGDADNWYINLWSDALTYCADLGFKTPDGRFAAAVRSNTVATPRGRASTSSEVLWTDMRQRQGSPDGPISAGDGGFGKLAGSGVPADQTTGVPGGLPCEYPVQSPGGSSDLSSPPGEGGMDLPGGSSELTQRPSFPFSIETELVVRGRTEPGSAIWYNGEVLHMAPDGTFGIHLNLPPGGSIPLDFTAQSADASRIHTLFTAVLRTPSVESAG